MRLHNLLSAPLLVAVVLLFSACDNSNQTTAAGTDTATVKSSAVNLPLASTIINRPQNMLVIQHKVADYAKWKMAYDAHEGARIAAGLHSYVIARGMLDSNMLQVTLRVDDTAKAMAFGKDPELKSTMQKGGVTGTPVIKLIVITYQDTVTLTSKLRSAVMFTVKDWNTWFKNFQEGAQERIDNGLVVRAYGHDAGDNTKIRVVTAIIDSAKAMAYFKSDMLKKRMEASGVTTPADRFLYRVAQLY